MSSPQKKDKGGKRERHRSKKSAYEETDQG